MRLVVIEAVVAFVATLVMAAETHIGPILFALSPRHGIHSGDLGPGALFLVVVAVQAASALVRRRRRCAVRTANRNDVTARATT